MSMDFTVMMQFVDKARTTCLNDVIRINAFGSG